MAAPNIVNVSTITAKTTALTPSGTSAVVLLRNPANSGQVLKVNVLLATNIIASNAPCTLNYYTNGGVAQGSAPSGGTAFPLISGVVIPTTASLIVVDKPTAIYLEENTSITVASATGSAITYLVSYEELS
jgi:hypothetical protein